MNITDSGFPAGVVRECQFFELREEDSEDWFQTTVNYWVFQTGQGMDGDIDAFVEIYNVPSESDRFIIEVTRNCWHNMTVSYQGEIFAVFPQVSGNVLSYGYMTYEVEK